MKRNDSAKRVIAAAATRRRNAAAATDAGDDLEGEQAKKGGKAKANCSRIAAAKVSTRNATASDNNKKVVIIFHPSLRQVPCRPSLPILTIQTCNINGEKL